ncbi:hypothetical protein PV11_03584 [Exophiala sideris]|uniref:Non-homologous end-joining factor 1 n=1 Tax=Exophiala sideris TaxID=1016849 RepID=A0A0D1Z3E6_9EURO|nr:hypothetical protein PV11_03584 [Exophiala sideris]
MPDSANEGWQELQVPSRRQCPKLFYSFATQDESLTLLITDLISIWECELDKYDILSHAARQHASIDPSVSSDQFDILLSKIGKSLKDGDNVLLRQDVRNSSLLMLRTKSDLPKPLRPLEWTFKLTPRDVSELAERILRPSLHEVAVSGEKIKSLLRVIKEKDHVISRLLDRVGSASIDLGLIFPGITGMASRKSGQVSVADAKKHVPGMAGFDEKSWIRQFSNDEGYEGADCTGLSNLVRGNEKCFAHTKSEHEDWIRELSTTDKASPELDRSSARLNEDPSKHSARETSRRQANSDDDSTDADNDFERQPTPPALQLKSPSKNKTIADDDRDETPPPKRKPHKIGGLGRRSATKSFGTSNSKSKSPTPAEKNNGSPPQRRTPDISDATATASEDGDDDDKIISDTRSSQRNRTNEAPTPNRKLGGLRKKPTTNQSPSPSPAPTSRPATRQHPSPTPDENEDEDSDLDLDHDHPPIRSPSAPTPSRHRLGRVGRKATASPSKSDAPSPAKPAQDRTSEAPSQNTPKRRLGRLGARKNQDKEESPSSNKKTTPKTNRANQDDEDDTSSPSPSPTTRKKLASQRTKPSQIAKSEPQSSPPMPDSATAPPAKESEPEKEETAEETANRRRMELKRTIASNAGAKKKRRF